MALNEAGNPYRCNCCWECGDCMPFTYVSLTCPAMNFGNFLCRSTAKPDWVVPSYTPKCKASWDDTGVDCIYGSGQITNDDCSCIGYFGAYCIDDSAGTNGRSWVVEFWCTDGLGGAAANYHTVVQDWTCACLGARFAYDLTIGGCCCECEPPPTCDNACCTDTPLTLIIDDGTSQITLELIDECTTWFGSTSSDFAGYCGPVSASLICEGLGGEMSLQIGPDTYGSMSISCSPISGSTVITSISGQPECGGGNDYTITVSE